jgi:hypothetical protein
MNMQNIVDIIPQALNEPVANVISDPLGSVTRAADYLLLLSYCTSAFSNYTTARPDTNGKTRSDVSGINFPKSITGVRLSPEVNYFYQSEWEYLYSGHQSAARNLSAVTRLILTIRIVCNYITVFKVSQVNALVNKIRLAFIKIPPLALVLSELARAAFVVTESVLDVADLRSGYSVPFVKSATQWICSPSGIAELMQRLASTGAPSTNTDADGNRVGFNRKNDGLTYNNYMMIFFIGKTTLGLEYASNQLADRIVQLIEWNVINYKNKIGDKPRGERPEAMAAALAADNVFRMNTMYTNFRISTKIDLRMLFLSMPFTYADWNLIEPPQHFPMEVASRRGY